MPTTLRNFRVSDEEYAQWQHAAERFDLDVSALVRAALAFALRHESSFEAVVTAGQPKRVKPDPKGGKAKK